MACPRCAERTDGTRWCGDCERGFDGWSRKYAGDLVGEVLSGTVVVLVFGMGLPLLGVTWLLATAGVFAGFGTVVGLHRLNRRRRRRQYLVDGVVPRAYLPSRT